MAYRDRSEAGQVLASHLSRYANDPSVLVLALPRGGVPVGFEVAHALHAPLDLYIVRKLGLPGQEELAIGAIASGGVRVLNEELLRSLQLSPQMIDAITAREAQELERRERLYRDDRPAPDVPGKTVIVIDDGLATGATMLAAVRALRVQGPKQLVVAVPVAARETCARFEMEVDEVVCPEMPDPFNAVGLWYDDFTQTSDAEVRDLLARAAREHVA